MGCKPEVESVLVSRTLFTGGATSALSAPYIVNVDLTAPTVVLTTATSTTTLAPQVRVTASDLLGLPDGTAVALDVDTNNNGNFTDPGETGYASGTLTGGMVQVVLPALAGLGTYPMRARVSDLAGNQGTSSTVNVTVASSGGAWTTTAASTGLPNHDPYDGMPRENIGLVSVSHALDLDASPGTGQGGNPALVYDSDTVNVQPIFQASVQTDNSIALPATITAQLTKNRCQICFYDCENRSDTGFSPVFSPVFLTPVFWLW
jgi:hypothetical protein